MGRAAGADGASTRSWLPPLLVLMVGSFMPPMDSSIVSVAISYIQKDMGAAADDVAWVSTAYSLGLAVFVPTSNWLATRFGLTRVHRAAMIGFTAGTTLCGLAWDLPSLIAFRVLAAIPGSILPVVTISMIYKVVPKQNIGAAMGIYGLGVVVAPGLGPTVGGLIVEDFSWRWVFDFKAPLGVAAIVAGLFLLPDLRKADGAPKPFDWKGFLAIGYGLAALVVVSSKGQKWGWTSYGVLILVVSALLSLALFVVIENEVADPLLDLRIFRCWPFVNSLLMIAVLMVGLFAMSYYLPEFLENVQSKTAGQTGMLFLPQAMVSVVLVPVVGRLYDRTGARWLAFTGMVMVALSTYLLSGITLELTRRDVILWTMIRAVGTSLAFMPVMTNGLNWLPSHLVGYGGAMNNIVQRVSSALGVSCMGVLITRSGAQLMSDYGSRVSTAVPVVPGSPVITAVPPTPGLTTEAGLVHEGVFGVYENLRNHIQAMADANMFLVAAGASAVCAVLALMLRRPPKAATPAGPPPARPRSTPAPAPARSGPRSAVVPGPGERDGADGRLPALAGSGPGGRGG